VLPPPLLWALSMTTDGPVAAATAREREASGWVCAVGVCVCVEKKTKARRGRRPHAEDNDNGAYHNCGVDPHGIPGPHVIDTLRWARRTRGLGS